MPRSVLLIAILLATLVFAACGKDDPRTAATETTAEEPAGLVTDTSTTPEVRARSAKDGCKAVPAPEPAAQPDRRRSRQKLSTRRIHTAILRTNCGTIRIRLDVRNSPKTTASFAGLARNEFFDGLTFHRIAKPGGNDYVIQGGDPLGTGTGGPGYRFADEFHPELRFDRPYLLAMANAGPGTNGSQFFITVGPTPHLNMKHTIFGEVADQASRDVVDAIATTATAARDRPSTDVVVESVEIEKVDS